ncbi:MAG TPA: alpha/beta hydrolase [Mycobacteriales bacterium]|nr:alpha/beta hydrolase [Mycobacteriales bacterium]
MSTVFPVARQVAVEGVRFSLHRLDPSRRRRTTPVLLLHGVPQTALVWRQIAGELGTDRTVLAPDLKGLGASESTGRYDIATLVHELAALVLHEVEGPVDVVGHDWGGSLALALSAARPELVRRLVVVSAPYRHIDLLHAFHIPLFSLPLLPELTFRLGRERLVRSMIRYCWKSPTALDPQIMAAYAAAYADPGRVRAMLAYYRATTRPRLASLAVGAMVPSRRRRLPPSRVNAERRLVVWGAADPVLPLAVGEAVVRDLGPGTVFVTVPGVGHFPVEEAPETVLATIADFLRQPSSAENGRRASSDSAP